MYPQTAWHAEGLRWIASLLEDAAQALERNNAHEALPDAEANSVEESRLRVHLRGF